MVHLIFDFRHAVFPVYAFVGILPVVLPQNTIKIRRLLNHRFNISYVETINENDVKITSAGKLYRVTAKYDSKVHLFGNVYVVMAFYKQVQVRRI